MTNSNMTVIPRDPLIQVPYPNEMTRCICGAPLVRHMVPLAGLGGVANVDQQYDPAVGKWVETRLVLHTTKYDYSCSVCHVAFDLCECARWR